LFPAQQAASGEFAVQEDFGAGFVEGVLIALSTIAKNAGRVIGCIFVLVSLLGETFLAFIAMRSPVQLLVSNRTARL
jgi:hypothetical protein